MNDKRQITILHLCEHFGGRDASLHGVAKAFQQWLPRFNKERYRVLLCSRKGPDKAAAEMVRSGINPLYLGYGKLDPRNLWKLIQLVRQEKIDIIHAHGYGACLWGRLAGHLLDIPVIVHEHCNYGKVPLFQRPVEFMLGPFTKHTFAVSGSTKDFCVKKRYLPAAAVDVLYIGIPLENIPPVTSEWIAQFRQKNGVGPKDIVLGVVGRLESHKGHRDAFLALQEVIKLKPNIKLWVLGDGSYAEHLRSWVSEHQLQEYVKFLGFRPDVLQVIRCFDLQLFPSHQEGTPITLFEAMAVGNAIVASTVDGQGEILEHEKTALLFAPGDHATMAKHIMRLLEDPTLAETLRSNARDRANVFDSQRCIDTLEQTYEEIFLSRHEKSTSK